MKIYKLIILSVAITAQLTLIRSQSLASSLYTQDICAGRSFLIKCDSSIIPQSIVFENSFYGIQKSNVSKCGYTQDDCGEEITFRHLSRIKSCGYNYSTCAVAASSRRRIRNCADKVATYLNVRYYCVPFSFTNNENTFDICSGDDEITESNGFLTSPGYPTFKAQNTTCIKKIRVPQGKSISIWVVDSNFGVRDSLGECSSSYVKITDTAYPSDFCGVERKPFYKKFCSNLIYVSYLATDYENDFRGFKLYFETYDVPAQSGCAAISTLPYPVSTTTIATTTGILPGQASPIYSLRLCAGDPAVTIKAPLYNLVFVESYFYGVPSSLTCESEYNPNHCTTEEPLPCKLKSSCQFRLNNVTSAACGNNEVQYLYITYRFLPSEIKYILLKI